MEVNNSPRADNKRPDIIFLDDLECEHKNQVTRVLKAVVTCETTAIFCKDCNKQLTEPETDCR